MANPLRKTMVYLGLAEEEFDDYEPAQGVSTTHQTQHIPQAASPQVAGQQAQRAPVTPLRRPARAVAPAAEMNEILTVHPRQYKDAQSIAEHFREGIPVIINLSQMSESEARRLVDFASGLSQGLHGRIERVTSKVFLLSPSHVVVSGEQGEIDSTVDASFFPEH